MPGMQQSRSSHALPLPTQRVTDSPALERPRKPSEPTATKEEATKEVTASDAYGVNDKDIDTLERRRRERAARRAREAEQLRIEQEKHEESLERRKKEREARRSQRKY